MFSRQLFNIYDFTDSTLTTSPVSKNVFQQSGAAQPSVTIVACGPCSNAVGVLVYAITVIQPVYSWTVIRSHSDFKDLDDALLRSNVPGTTDIFPILANTANISDAETVLNIRNDLQEWLSAVLMFPSTYEVPDVKSFLTLGANTLPPIYSNVSWIWVMHQFPATTSHPVGTAHQSYTDQSQGSHHQNQLHSSGNSVNLDDMEMADMFISMDDDNNPTPNDDHEYDDDIPPASVRYKPTEEAVTEEDEMELMQVAGEVEMIEDLGSFAQSLGASHLGRSLKLQAALKHPSCKNSDIPSRTSALPSHQQGLNIGALSSAQPSQQQQTSPRGGIGSVMEQAANNNVSHFNHRPPTSAPRLDSFKMIKVIGKGSFGTFIVSLFSVVMYLCFSTVSLCYTR